MDAPKRSRFGWIGKLNWLLSWCGLVIVWVTPHNEHGEAGSGRYRLWSLPRWIEHDKNI